MSSQRVPLPMDTARSPSEPAEKPQVQAGPENRPADPAAGAPPADLEEQIIAALRTCFDPEIPVNIYEMGLIYGIDIDPSGAVNIRMTLTSPACPAAGSLPPDVQAKVQAVPGVTSAKVEVVWDPIWNPEMMSDAAKIELGMF